MAAASSLLTAPHLPTRKDESQSRVHALLQAVSDCCWEICGSLTRGFKMVCMTLQH